MFVSISSKTFHECIFTYSYSYVVKSLHKKAEEIVAYSAAKGLQAAKATGQCLPSLTVMVEVLNTYLQDENNGYAGPLDSVPEAVIHSLPDLCKFCGWK